ncbi:MAG: hypothetical protein ABIK93_04725 [candidate division WOR-3 bacterium]
MVVVKRINQSKPISPQEFTNNNYEPQFFWCAKYARLIEDNAIAQNQCQRINCSHLLRAWRANNPVRTAGHFASWL